MTDPIMITPAELWQIFLAICGAIVAVSSAAAVIVNIIHKAKEPNKKQDERLTALEDRVKKIEDRLQLGNLYWLGYHDMEKKVDELSMIPPNSNTWVYPMSKSFCAASLLLLPLLQYTSITWLRSGSSSGGTSAILSVHKRCQSAGGTSVIHRRTKNKTVVLIYLFVYCIYLIVKNALAVLLTPKTGNTVGDSFLSEPQHFGFNAVLFKYCFHFIKSCGCAAVFVGASVHQ